MAEKLEWTCALIVVRELEFLGKLDCQFDKLRSHWDDKGPRDFQRSNGPWLAISVEVTDVSQSRMSGLPTNDLKKKWRCLPRQFAVSFIFR